MKQLSINVSFSLKPHICLTIVQILHTQESRHMFRLLLLCGLKCCINNRAITSHCTVMRVHCLSLHKYRCKYRCYFLQSDGWRAELIQVLSVASTVRVNPVLLESSFVMLNFISRRMLYFNRNIYSSDCQKMQINMFL